MLGLIWFWLLVAPGSALLYGVAAVIGIGLSVWACGKAERLLNARDPGCVVLDEIIAMPLCGLVWVGWQWNRTGTFPDLRFFLQSNSLWVAFGILVAFRCFDIWKPWPIRWADRNVPGGLGVMLDDVLAGSFAAAVLALGLWALNWQ